MGSHLHRYWFLGSAEESRYGASGLGVTAGTEAEARALLNQQLPQLGGLIGGDWSAETLAKAAVVTYVDVRLLDAGHVLPNMGDVSVRGVWWPKL